MTPSLYDGQTDTKRVRIEAHYTPMITKYKVVVRYGIFDDYSELRLSALEITFLNCILLMSNDLWDLRIYYIVAEIREYEFNTVIIR